jgi:hypothetical protein
MHTGFELINAAYREPASIRPLLPNPNTVSLPGFSAYLVCGCVARKTGDALVKWDAEVSEVFDLHYSHGLTSNRIILDTLQDAGGRAT